MNSSPRPTLAPVPQLVLERIRKRDAGGVPAASSEADAFRPVASCAASARVDLAPLLEPRPTSHEALRWLKSCVDAAVRGQLERHSSAPSCTLREVVGQARPVRHYVSELAASFEDDALDAWEAIRNLDSVLMNAHERHDMWRADGK